MSQNIVLQKYKFNVTVSRLEWPEFMDDMLDWCRNSCCDEWCYGLQHSGPDGSIEYVFSFCDRNDYVGFAIIWGIT